MRVVAFNQDFGKLGVRSSLMNCSSRVIGAAMSCPPGSSEAQSLNGRSVSAETFGDLNIFFFFFFV